jgi:hypothetical protein
MAEATTPRELNSTASTLDFGEELPEKAVRLIDLADKFDKFCGAILLCFCFVGNLICLIVLNTKALKSCPQRRLLMIIALLDIGIAVTSLREYVRKHLMTEGFFFKAAFHYNSSASCKIAYYLGYLNCHLSAWSVTLLTTERFLAIGFPLRFRNKISSKHVTLAWVVMATILCLINIPMFFAIDYKPELQYSVECDFTTDGWKTFLERFDLVVMCVGPILIISILNSLILYKLYGNKREMTSARSGEEEKLSGITAMMLSVCLSYIVTTMPITIYSYMYLFKESEDFLTNAKRYMLMTILCNLYLVNHCLNFVFYLASGRLFRNAFRDTFRCKCPN